MTFCEKVKPPKKLSLKLFNNLEIFSTIALSLKVIVKESVVLPIELTSLVDDESSLMNR